MLINMENDKFKEECGVFGIFSNDNIDVSHITYFGLYALQHRGQESAGIAVSGNEKISVYKDMGLLSDVFTNSILNDLKGDIAIGHVRYSTCGESDVANAQPMMVHSKSGDIAMAHNGTITNSKFMKEILEDAGSVFQTSSDSEVILKLIGRNTKDSLENAIIKALHTIQGSYAIVIALKDKLIAVRDPNGIRPLCLGKIKNSYVISSESCAFDSIGAEFIRDIEPGEVLIIDSEGMNSFNIGEKTPCTICSFEYIYFARPDSIIDNINVYESRMRAGEILFKESPVEADVIVGVPDSGLGAAAGYAKASGIPYASAFVKNKYIGRTFIEPTQEMRERSVSIKLNVIKSMVSGKKVVLVDDSIVRGTTSKRLVELLRSAGATEVHFRISSPIVKYPCYFGIDTPYRDGLIGATMNSDEIRAEIGADSLGFITIDGLLKSFGSNNGFCLGCFTGIYPVCPSV